MEEVFAKYFTGEGLNASQQAGARGGQRARPAAAQVHRAGRVGRREGRLPDARVGRVRDGVGAPRLHGRQLVGRLGGQPVGPRRGLDRLRDRVPAVRRRASTRRCSSSSSTTSARPTRPASSRRRSAAGRAAARARRDPRPRRAGRVPRDRQAHHRRATATRRRRRSATPARRCSRRSTQAPYDVSNTDYFRDLRHIVSTPVTRCRAEGVGARTGGLSTLVVADTTEADPAALRRFVADGGNLVLTDGALGLLPRLVDIPEDAIESTTSYVGYADLDRKHPWTEGLYKRARQLFDPVGLGYPLLMERDQYWPCSRGMRRVGHGELGAGADRRPRGVGGARRRHRSGPPTRSAARRRARGRRPTGRRSGSCSAARAGSSSSARCCRSRPRTTTTGSASTRTRSRSPASSCCCARCAGTAARPRRPSSASRRRGSA